MNYRSGILTGAAAALLIVGSGIGIFWLLVGSPIEVLKSPLPKTEATVPKPASEGQFNTVILSADAEKKLGLARGTAKREKMPRSRFYGGDVLVPPGQAIIVSAPVSGLVKDPSTEKTIPKAGQLVDVGQPILQLLPLLTPEGRVALAQALVDAVGVEKKAQIDLAGAKLALDREVMLLADKTGSQRKVDEARVVYDGLQKLHDAAAVKVKLLNLATGEADAGTASAIPLTSPEKGFLRILSVVAGQHVPVGAVLFEVVDTRSVWIRVPVYVGDLPDLDLTQSSRIGNLSKRSQEPLLEAKSVVAPPSANALAGTVDVFYQFDNATAKYSPGHRVGVTIPIKGEVESLTIPWAAVIHDVQGGTWVYEQTVEHTYVRRRVVVQYVVGEMAVLKDGNVKTGATLITGGSAELFGTETGYSK